MNLRVKLDNKERGYYASLYQAVDANNTNQIGGAQAVQFFKRSGLPVDTLKKIWLLSSPNNQTLNKEEFYVALKLISYAQNKIDVSQEAIQRGTPSPLPQFQTEPEDIYRMRPEQERLYQTYLTQLDHQNNTVQNQLAFQLFAKASVSHMQIQTIINLVDNTIYSKPRMTASQYVVIAHLLSLVSQGVVIPQVLPKSLQEYINQHQSIKSPDLLEFENSVNEQQSQTPTNKYSAFNLIDEQPAQSPVSQNQQQQGIKKQYSLDVSGDLVNEQPQLNVDADTPPVYKKQVSSDINQQFSQQYIKMQNNQQQFQQQQQQFQEIVNQNNELLKQITEQNENQLKYQQQQLDQMNKMNEQYKTILKKMGDENDLFQDEMKNLNQNKRNAIDLINQQAQDIYLKLGINVQIKQDYSKQSNQLIHDVTTHSKNILEVLKQQYLTEEEHKHKVEQQILKEIKLQKDQIAHLSHQISQINQRKPSYQQYQMDNNSQDVPIITSQQLKNQIQTQSHQFQFDNQVVETKQPPIIEKTEIIKIETPKIEFNTGTVQIPLTLEKKASEILEDVQPQQQTINQDDQYMFLSKTEFEEQQQFYQQLDQQQELKLEQQEQQQVQQEQKENELMIKQENQVVNDDSEFEKIAKTEDEKIVDEPADQTETQKEPDHFGFDVDGHQRNSNEGHLGEIQFGFQEFPKQEVQIELDVKEFNNNWGTNWDGFDKTFGNQQEQHQGQQEQTANFDNFKW